MVSIRLGVVGLSSRGWASQALIPPLFDSLLSAKYTITALCTSSEASATDAVAKYSKLTGHIVKGYHGKSGPSDIAADPDVDMVVVSVKIPDHYNAVMPAIEAGKDVFVEWTPGNGLDQTLKIAEAAKRKGVRCLVGSQGHHSASTRKVKDLIDSGKIGRVISTSAILTIPSEIHFWGPTVNHITAYSANLSKGATMLTIPVGHLIVVLGHVLGDFSEVSASGAVRIPTASFVDLDGKPTGEIIPKTAHDQVALSGVLKGEHDGVFANIHCRAGMECTGDKAGGRHLFQWTIDGELGSIEVRNRVEDGPLGCFIATEKRVFLNGEEVSVEREEIDKLGNTGKAWLEFAKGNDGKYTTLDEAVKVHRVLDAALTSIQDGRRVYLQ